MGILGAGQIGTLNDKIVSALGENTQILFFDFSRIEDLTPAGAGFLVALKKRMRGRGGDLIVYGLRPKQQRFLESLGFRGFFSVALDLRYAEEYILEMKRDIFPIAAVCPACSTPLGIERPGRSRCRACKAVLTVLADGSVELG
jgi:anti-anti-sigma regulatory factor